MKDPAVHLDGRIRDSGVAMMRKYGGIKERHHSTVTDRCGPCVSKLRCILMSNFFAL